MELIVNILLCSYLCTYLGKESEYGMYNRLPKKKRQTEIQYGWKYGPGTGQHRTVVCPLTIVYLFSILEYRDHILP